MRGDSDPLFEAARAWLKRQYGPAIGLQSVQLNTTHGLVPIVLAAPHAEPPAVDRNFELQPGKGFRSLRVGLRLFSFTAAQSKAVEVLYDAWMSGAPDVPDSDLLRAVNTDATRMVDVFRNCEAWGTIIVEGQTRGTHRIDTDPAT